MSYGYGSGGGYPPQQPYGNQYPPQQYPGQYPPQYNSCPPQQYPPQQPQYGYPQQPVIIQQTTSYSSVSVDFGAGNFIRCHDTGFVLDVEGGRIHKHTPIILWHKKDNYNASNQKWVLTSDGFIHILGHHHLVLDVENDGGQGSRVILWERKHHHNQNQKWNIEGHFIVSRASGLVLDVQGGSHHQGAQLIVWPRKHHDNMNQRFSFVPNFEFCMTQQQAPITVITQQYTPPPQQYMPPPQTFTPPPVAYVSPPPVAYAPPVITNVVCSPPIVLGNQGHGHGHGHDAKFIRCHDTGFVIDVQHGNIRSGAHIILWHKKHGHDANNQRWVFTHDGFIHLQGHPNLVLDIEGGGGKGSKIILWEKKHHNNANQKWHLEGHFIVSRSHHGLVLDVEGGSHREGAHLIAWERKHFHNHNQKFSFVHGW